MSELEHTITLVLGDWSKDGHNISHNEYIKSNFSIEEIEKAYKIGAVRLNVDLTEDIAAGYDENSLPFEELKKFIDAGFLEKYDGFSKDDLKSIKNKTDIEYLDSDLFIELYLFTILCGNDKFKYKILNASENTSINIGGYGLFGN